MLRDTVRVRVTDGGACDGRVLGRRVLLEVCERAAVRQLLDAFAVAEVTEASCMCHGDLAFELFDGRERLTAVVGFHQPGRLRWSGWDGDARLRDGGAVLRWLADRGVDGPLARERERQRHHHELDLAERRWRVAAPAAVCDVLDAAIAATRTDGILPEGMHRLVAGRLRAAIADPLERAAVTLAWYGSGTGRCSGFPIYEALPASALAETPIADLVQALQANLTDARVVAGALRHLCGWKTRRHQAGDIAEIPPALRLRLLAAAGESGDADMRERAQRWLGAASSHRPW